MAYAQSSADQNAQLRINAVTLFVAIVAAVVVSAVVVSSMVKGQIANALDVAPVTSSPGTSFAPELGSCVLPDGTVVSGATAAAGYGSAKPAVALLGGISGSFNTSSYVTTNNSEVNTITTVDNRWSGNTMSMTRTTNNNQAWNNGNSFSANNGNSTTTNTDNSNRSTNTVVTTTTTNTVNAVSQNNGNTNNQNNGNSNATTTNTTTNTDLSNNSQVNGNTNNQNNGNDNSTTSSNSSVNDSGNTDVVIRDNTVIL